MEEVETKKNQEKEGYAEKCKVREENINVSGMAFPMAYIGCQLEQHRDKGKNGIEEGIFFPKFRYRERGAPVGYGFDLDKTFSKGTPVEQIADKQKISQDNEITQPRGQAIGEDKVANGQENG